MIEDSKTRIIRAVKDVDNPYAQIARAAIQDASLSLKATGLLALLLSFPDNWTVYVKDLIKRKVDGKTSIRTSIRELVKAGYIERRERRGEDGRFYGLDYIVHEDPWRGAQTEPKLTAHKKGNGRGYQVPWAEIDSEAMRRDVEAAGMTYTEPGPRRIGDGH